jgi:hypothetical protein
MPFTIKADAYIKGGLPVIAVGRVYPAEPDVGSPINVELDDICWTDGRSLPTHLWADLSDDDREACENALLEAEGIFE